MATTSPPPDPGQHAVDLIIFDLDGTLIDTRQDIANSVNYALERLSLPLLSLNEVMRNVGDGVRMLLLRSLPETHHDKVDRAVALFREHYGEHLLVHSRPYPEVETVLQTFASKHLAVVSNKPESFTLTILRELGLARRFSHILGGDSLAKKKPDPAPLLHIMQALNCPPQRAAMVGDSPGDIQAGKAAGTITCGVSYGYRPKALLEAQEPDYLLDRLDELVEILG